MLHRVSQKAKVARFLLRHGVDYQQHLAANRSKESSSS